MLISHRGNGHPNVHLNPNVLVSNLGSVLVLLIRFGSTVREHS
jgi:hypothetical protein